MNRRIPTIIALFLALTVLSSCWAMGDHGFRMEPVGMDRIDSQNLWTKRFDGFELRVGKIEELIGEWWLNPNIAITTDSQPVTVLGADLYVESAFYQPTPILEPTVVIPAFSRVRPLAFWWDFSKRKTADKALGESSRIVLHLRVGSKTEIAEIVYKRVKCCL
jgi:hypothetical protein